MTQDAKKDEFRKYLEKAGVLELLTKSLVQLYEEPDKPQDALAYLKNSVGGNQDDKTIIAKLREENEELKRKCKEIETEKSKLESRVKELQDGGMVTEQTEEVEKAVPAPAVEAAAPTEAPPPVPEAEPEVTEDASASKPAEEDKPAPTEAAPVEAMETEAPEVAAAPATTTEEGATTASPGKAVEAEAAPTTTTTAAE